MTFWMARVSLSLSRTRKSERVPETPTLLCYKTCKNMYKTFTVRQRFQTISNIHSKICDVLDLLFKFAKSIPRKWGWRLERMWVSVFMQITIRHNLRKNILIIIYRIFNCNGLFLETSYKPISHEYFFETWAPANQNKYFLARLFCMFYLYFLVSMIRLSTSKLPQRVLLLKFQWLFK